SWSVVTGFSPKDGLPEVREPLQAIETIMNSDSKGIFVLKDFSAFINQPPVTRALRDAYYSMAGKDKFIFIVSPELVIPESLKKEIQLVEMDLPDETELRKQITKIVQSYSSNLPPETISQIVFALKGLTLNEATHIMNRILRAKKEKPEEILDEIFSEKESIVKKSGYLEFVPPRTDLSQIGGLDNLKDWLVRREKLFSKQALDDGMPVPKGMLIMGMSGCGKSLAAKTISALWKVPLFRLDMNLVFSGMYGSPELSFHRALKTVEAVSPVVLWIDEIENSLQMDDNQAGANSLVFSSFLTWMQEKPPLIFVAATANRIQAIPAEVIRKGRFDQVFFVDLPNDEERKQIFEIHLRKHGANLGRFDLVFLGAVTKGWNGAEIEQVVSAARVDAYHDGREITQEDVTRNTSRTVPLSKTMEEQMKKIRSWAFGRATPASKYASVPRI
ncbi:MAG TPA: AAA family ATPase, partial [Acidobacteriota bacterium]|nr:AAA family ATPase [Acidobacteriota bacterium]